MTKQDVLGMYFKCADLNERTRLIERLEAMGLENCSCQDVGLFVGVDKFEMCLAIELRDYSDEQFFNGTVTSASDFLAQFKPAINEHGDDFHAVPDELKTI